MLYEVITMVAISSGGKAPVLARLLRERLEALLPQHLGALARLSGALRAKVKQTFASLADRRITSYNVCYTKLLRAATERQIDRIAEALLQ